MKNLIICALLLFLSACSTTCTKTGNSNLSVAVGFEDPYSELPLTVKNRARMAMQDALSDENIRVVSMANGNGSRQELIDQANAEGTLDALVVLSGSVVRQDKSFGRAISGHLDANTIALPNGRSLSNDSVSLADKTVGKDCRGSCMKEAVGEQMRIAARALSETTAAELKDELGECLDGAPKSSGDYAKDYDVIFSNFSSEQIADFEAQLMEFDGYADLRPSLVTGRRAEYLYRSSLGSAALNRALNDMMKNARDGYRLSFASNQFLIEKTVQRAAPRNAPADTGYEW